ncbi:hypothetical protein [Solibacillus isronensis]|uniref:hypothetical protein n=1 Tax=Solibacillus isronensis TaxID=412383 RepID=UPI00203D35CC|nr:hypothetical protein [Solibacillus isronensis]MCM3720487.1 hypothetical protein [Solibacillus isronensis]
MFVLTVSPFALLKHQLTAMPFPTSKASCGNSVMPETTGSDHARGKRPGMEINFTHSKKIPFFSKEKNGIFGYGQANFILLIS